MKVQNQIHECMSFMEFKSALKRFFAAGKGISGVIKLRRCDEILDEISDSFDDEYENIKRWLCGMPILKSKGYMK